LSKTSSHAALLLQLFGNLKAPVSLLLLLLLLSLLLLRDLRLCWLLKADTTDAGAACPKVNSTGTASTTQMRSDVQLGILSNTKVRARNTLHCQRRLRTLLSKYA
jgi:hypothetical protein